tara:strand:+ start:204 stop:575 length:372 start_codon:yes stop_codon:yes gene_type:complete
MAKQLSFRLAKLMKERDISQNALSRATRISQPTINRILCEVTLNPNLASLVALSNFFGVTVDFMCGRESKNKADNVLTSLDEFAIKFKSLSDSEKLALFEHIMKSHKETGLDSNCVDCCGYLI